MPKTSTKILKYLDKLMKAYPGDSVTKIIYAAGAFSTPNIQNKSNEQILHDLKQYWKKTQQ